MKVGIAGAGMIVNDLFRFIHEVENIELEAIASTPRSLDKVKKMAEEQGIKKYYSCYDELLEDDEVEVMYIASPNHLHYEMCKKALEKGKHVICEKPFTSHVAELKELAKLAKEKQLILLEAISTQYLPNVLKIKELLNEIGQVKIVSANYSQYSSRYNAFKEGNILPAFDYTKSGGALMDLNIYNIHFVVGLFGKPKDVHYYPNIENHIDTSGILILEYETFQCVCIGAKDCKAPLSNNIQGDQGCLHVPTPLSYIGSMELLLNDGTKEIINDNKDVHRMYEEFMAFVKMYQNNDYQQCYEMLEHSMIVTEVQTIARRKAGVVFPADEKHI